MHAKMNSVVLRVGAAVGAGPGNEERIDALVKAGVDVLLIDSSHGHSEGVLQRVRETRAKYPNLPTWQVTWQLLKAQSH